MNDRRGERFGNYRLLHLLGRGGFAEVYLGEHIHLNTHAALKILHVQGTYDDLQAFRREAQTIATLKHPHIISVLDFGIERQTPYLVMELAIHGTLRAASPKNARLPLDTCVTYLKQIASALDYAHARQVIHRDVKPENMLLGDHRALLLSDFGIAILSLSSRYQGKQEIGGTVIYMAPEQLLGKAVPASDQYAVGIILYEWLAGTVPFTGTFTEVCSQHVLATPPPLSGRYPGISSAIEAVVVQALAKDPLQRYPTVTAFADAFANAFEQQTGTSFTLKSSPIPSTSTTNQVRQTTPQIQHTGVGALPQPDPTAATLPNTVLPHLSPTLPHLATQTIRSGSIRPKHIAGYLVVAALLLFAIIFLSVRGASILTGQKASTSILPGHPSPAKTSPPATSIPSPTVLAMASSGTLSLNTRLTTTSDSSVLVHVSKINIDTDQGTATWSLQIQNLSGHTQGLALAQPTLQSSLGATRDAPHHATGPNVIADCVYIDSGAYTRLDTQASADITFSFVPYAKPISYRLSLGVCVSSVLGSNFYNQINIPYGPNTFTF